MLNQIQTKSIGRPFMGIGIVLFCAITRIHSQIIDPVVHTLTEEEPLIIDEDHSNVSVTWTAKNTLSLDPAWADWSDPAIYLEMRLPPRVRTSIKGTMFQAEFEKMDATWQTYFTLPLDNVTAVRSNDLSIPIPFATTINAPSPTLDNGDFTLAGAEKWNNAQKAKDYQGNGFIWKYTSVNGWTAYRGKAIEVWNSADGQGNFIELDASKGSTASSNRSKMSRLAVLFSPGWNPEEQTAKLRKTTIT